LPQPIKGKKATEEDLGGFLKAVSGRSFRGQSDGGVGRHDCDGMDVHRQSKRARWPVPPGRFNRAASVFTLKGAEFFRVDAEGLIVDERGYFDLVSFLTQIGAMPQPQASH
jgi:hypothetical protein